MPNPKCLLFKIVKPPTETELSVMSVAIPFARNCIECPKRAAGRLDKMCIKEI